MAVPAAVKVTVPLDDMVRLSHTAPVSSVCLVANAPVAVPERSTTKLVSCPPNVNEYAAASGRKLFSEKACDLTSWPHGCAVETHNVADSLSGRSLFLGQA